MSDAAVDLVRLRELAVDANCEGGSERDELNRYLTPAHVLDLTARLANAEGEREYWKKACANEKAQHDQTIATNKAAVEQAHAALRDVNECSPWPPLQDYANWMDWRQKHAAALTSAAGGRRE